MRWVGPARTVHAVGQTVVKYRRSGEGRRVPMAIPDHVEVCCRMVQGGLLRLMVSAVIGHAPAATVTLYGTDGTIRLTDGHGTHAGFELWAGRREDDGLQPVDIAPERHGGWRVEEEFVNAIRGKQPVTHTDFTTGVKYMEWTDAVARSTRTGTTVYLPLEFG